jgi:hydrogenase nickel incorporation protein HypA/HybF
MHELTAAQNALSLAIREAAKLGATRVKGVRMKSRLWTMDELDNVRFHFDTLAKGTPAEDAVLSTEELPIKFKCENCGLEYEADDGECACPSCPSGQGVLVGGKTLYVQRTDANSRLDA